MRNHQDQRQVRIGFISRPDAGPDIDPNGMPVQGMSDVLLALQRALFASAAFQLGLSSGRNLTDEQRQRFTLEIVGVEAGSVLVFAKFLVESAAQGVIGGMAWDTLKTMIGTFRQVSQGDHFDPGYAQVVLPYLVDMIEAAGRSDKYVETTYRDASGVEFSFRTSPEGDQQIIQAQQRLNEIHRPQLSDEFQQFEHGRVLDIITTDHSLVLKFPYFPEPVTCIYRLSLEEDVVHSIRAHDVISIFGRVKQTPRGIPRNTDVYIEVDSMLTAQGFFIVDKTPPF